MQRDRSTSQSARFISSESRIDVLDRYRKPVASESTQEDALALVQETLDLMPAHIAMLDRDGAIVAVNRAWKEFASNNGCLNPAVFTSTNYLELCDHVAGEGREHAARAARMIREVIAGTRESGSMEYPCHSPVEDQWFCMHVRRFTAPGPVQVVVSHESITTLKHAVLAERTAREEVERSREQMRAALDSVTDAFFIFDTDWRFVYVNPRGAAMAQGSPEELVGQRLWELFPDLIGTDVERNYLRCMHERVHVHFGFRYEPFGLTLEIDLYPSSDGATAYIRDVTNRARAQDELLAREEQLNALVGIQQEIATADVDLLGVKQLVANRALDLTRATGAIVWSVNGGDLISDAVSGSAHDVPEMRLKMRASLVGKAVSDQEMLRCTDVLTDDRVDRAAADVLGIRSMIAVPIIHDGIGVGVLEVYATEPNYFDDADGRTLRLLTGLIGASIGRTAALEAKQAAITERTAALNALREREEYFRSLIENAADPVLIIDADGKMRYASPAFERVLGYSPDEVMGRSAMEIIHASEIDRAYEVFGRVFDGAGRIVTSEVVMRHKDDSWRTLVITARNLLNDPAVHGLVVNLRDVTDQKLLAEQLRLSQRLESVGQLAGGIAHDFNNLLTVIKLHGELLADAVAPGGPAADDVAQIRAAADRAAGLTRQLLAFSRRQILQPRVLDLNAVVTSISPMLRRLIDENIEFALLPSLGEKPTVLADPGQLEQVLVNLAVNARDAMPDGGALTMETQVVELDEKYIDSHNVVMPGTYVLLSVSDTGTGMDSATRSRLFEPFFTTKEPGKGTGLGLATVYGIVKQSGGYIWVYSEPGEGSIFKIYLPLVADELSPERPVVSTPLARGTETVLLVEDEEAVRMLARRILERSGYVVLEARHGGDAIMVSEQFAGTIHLLVSDVVMPHMGGRELVENLRPKRPDMRILYMSGYTDDDVLKRGLVDSHDAFIQKPFSAHALTRTVRDTLDAKG
jgi:PAS domain S-box-containing protein